MRNRPSALAVQSLDNATVIVLDVAARQGGGRRCRIGKRAMLNLAVALTAQSPDDAAMIVPDISARHGGTKQPRISKHAKREA